MLADFIGTCLLKDLSQRADLGRALARHLIEDQTADKMLGRMAQDIQSIDPHTPDATLRNLVQAYALHSFGAPNMLATERAHAIGSFVDALQQYPSSDQYKTLAKTLVRVKDLLGQPTRESQVVALLSRQGAGVCMAVFAAQQLLTSQGEQAMDSGPSAHAHEAAVAIRAAALPSTRPISQYADIYVGHHVVEIDVRGDITMRDGSGSAMVWVGDIKSSASQLGAGLQRLALRLTLLEWALRTVRPDLQSVFKTGKLYLPQCEAEDVGPLHEVVPTDHLFMVVGIW
uniref:Uncharacterized protein n=1 Tax=Chlamydomonas leiostraca TaxID=1034604 RepID=A0A7S0WR33_9CHLO